MNINIIKNSSKFSMISYLACHEHELKVFALPNAPVECLYFDNLFDVEFVVLTSLLINALRIIRTEHRMVNKSYPLV